MFVDYAIIGGGIAGLYAALGLSKKYPKAKIAIFEKYNILGGRVLTYRSKSPVGKLQWEKGAGRIHESHVLTRGLLKQFGLQEAPLSADIGWKENYDSHLIPNPFDDSLKTWLPEVKKIEKHILAKHTIHEILTKIFGETKARELTLPFPYYGEIFTMRADMAIESFEREMGSYANYYYSPDGYDELIHRMANICKARGVEINTNWDLQKALPTTDPKVFLWFATGPLKQKNYRKVVQVTAKHAIFAMHQEALKKINMFTHLPLLKYVKMEPLHRIYAVFEKAWFKDIPKFVTATPIRFFIPVDPSRGIVMISYTDGKDAQIWTDIAYGAEPKEEILAKLLTEECRKLFPEKEIPYPNVLKSHPWDYGCTYWLPGDYDPKILSKKSLQPFGEAFPVYICGESFSLRQAWMEGALENTQELLRSL